ncbi:general transcription factor II-I repeat domain-containing protein 2-like [Watersipora subatra]|uniref:general transcription factor II-I repeat domain-containing protein 2-like n=1 Tax=Watersipora subatra TaxID=2589382 RepID=UPI00355BFAD8
MEKSQADHNQCPIPRSNMDGLWRAKKGLAGKTSEDPVYPKNQFPSKELCPLCRNPKEMWNPETEYNIKRHYRSIHSAMHDTSLGQARLDKLEQMTLAIKKQQGVFTSYKKDSELVTDLSFKVLMACVAHFEGNKGALINLTDYSSSVLKNTVQQQMELNKEPEKTVCAKVKGDSLVVRATINKNCFSRLVNKSKLEKAKRNYSELSVADDSGDISVSPSTKKTLRSASNVKLSSSKPVLERVCAICEKHTGYLFVKSETVHDKLMGAKTVHAVRWLSRASTLKRFGNLRKEIVTFMVNKQQDVACLTDNDSINDLAFLTDIAQHISNLDVKLPDKCQKCEPKFTLLSQPFDIVPEDSPGRYKMEMIELKSHADLRRAYTSPSVKSPKIGTY